MSRISKITDNNETIESAADLIESGYTVIKSLNDKKNIDFEIFKVIETFYNSLLENQNWKKEPLHALKLVLSAIKNKDIRKKYLNVYKEFVESLNIISSKEIKIRGLDSRNTPVPTNNIEDTLERKLEIFDWDEDIYDFDLRFSYMGESGFNLEDKIFLIKWNKFLNEKILKGELICSFDVKFGNYGNYSRFDKNYLDFNKGKIHASENCILINKSKNSTFKKNDVVGLVRAFNNELDFKNLQIKTKKKEDIKIKEQKIAEEESKKKNLKNWVLAFLMITYFVVLFFWDGVEALYEEPWQWWLFIFPGGIISFHLFRFLLQIDDW